MQSFVGVVPSVMEEFVSIGKSLKHLSKNSGSVHTSFLSTGLLGMILYTKSLPDRIARMCDQLNQLQIVA